MSTKLAGSLYEIVILCEIVTDATSTATSLALAPALAFATAFALAFSLAFAALAALLHFQPVGSRLLASGVFRGQLLKLGTALWNNASDKER